MLAASLSRMHAQERQTADLIAARDGWLATGTGRYEFMAGVALNLLLRSTFLWFEDGNTHPVRGFRRGTGHSRNSARTTATPLRRPLPPGLAIRVRLSEIHQRIPLT